MSDDEKIQAMIGIGFPDIYAHVYVRAKGLCEYCGLDVIFDRMGYAGIQIDHIHPRSKGGKDQLNNFALSCSICNSIKSDWVPGEFYYAVTREDRIKAACKVIASRRVKHDRTWAQVIGILRGNAGAKTA